MAIDTTLTSGAGAVAKADAAFAAQRAGQFTDVTDTVSAGIEVFQAAKEMKKLEEQAAKEATEAEYDAYAQEILASAEDMTAEQYAALYDELTGYEAPPEEVGIGDVQKRGADGKRLKRSERREVAEGRTAQAEYEYQQRPKSLKEQYIDGDQKQKQMALRELSDMTNAHAAFADLRKAQAMHRTNGTQINQDATDLESRILAETMKPDAKLVKDPSDGKYKFKLDCCTEEERVNSPYGEYVTPAQLAKIQENNTVDLEFRKGIGELKTQYMNAAEAGQEAHMNYARLENEMLERINQSNFKSLVHDPMLGGSGKGESFAKNLANKFVGQAYETFGIDQEIIDKADANNDGKMSEEEAKILVDEYIKQMPEDAKKEMAKYFAGHIAGKFEEVAADAPEGVNDDWNSQSGGGSTS